MKVLFVASGNKIKPYTPIIKAQYESIKSAGIYIDVFSVVGKGILGYIKNIFKLKYFLKKSRYDIIHAHYGECGIISFIAKKKEKLVVSFMGGDILGDVNENGKKLFFSFIISRLNALMCYFYNLSIVKSKNIYDRLIFKKKQ